MTLPNLGTVGSTGVLQSPGFGGAVAQGLSGLPAILQKIQEQEMERQRNETARLQVEGQLSHLQALEQIQRQRMQQEAMMNQAVGQGLQAVGQPALTDVQIPGGLPATLPVGPPMTELDVARRLPAQAAPEFLKHPALKSVREEREATRYQTEANRFFGLAPEQQTLKEASAVLRRIPASKHGDFLNAVKELRGPEGTWTKTEIGPDRKIKFYNPVKDQEWTPPGSPNAPPPSPLVSVNMPGETERRAGALFGGAIQALQEIRQLETEGYNPLSESVFSKSAGEAQALPGLGKMARRVQYAALSSKGKLYYNSVYRLLSNYLYAVSGAQQSPQEIDQQAAQLATGLFDEPSTMAQKTRFLVGKVEELGVMGGRSVPGNIPLPKTWDELIRLGGGDPNPYRARP